MKTPHDWELVVTNVLTMVRTYSCHRCGSVVKLFDMILIDVAARQSNIPEDCNDAVAYNLHEL